MNLFALLCCSTPGTALTPLTSRTTRQNFGEVQRVVFQRRLNGTVVNSWTIGTDDPKLKATWTTTNAAADATKTVFSPYTEGLAFTPGAAISFGGNGETLGGTQRNVGKEPTNVEGMFYGLWQSTIQEIEDLNCDDISVFLVNECGQIAGISDDPVTPTTFRGFPIAIGTLFFGDKKIGGKTEDDSNAVKWQFIAGWSKYFTVLTPTDFSPVDDASLNTIF
jgi:hypothetical protein